MKLAIGLSLQVSFKFPRGPIGSPGNSIVQFLVDHQVAGFDRLVLVAFDGTKIPGYENDIPDGSVAMTLVLVEMTSVS